MTYTKAQMEVIELQAEDVVLTSPGGGTDCPVLGEDV